MNTTATRPFTIRPAVVGGYELVRDGKVIGSTRKNSRYYNLDRPLWVHYWNLSLDGFETPEHFDTRRDALARAEELLATIEPAEEPETETLNPRQGTTCYINGERGTIATNLGGITGNITAAFVQLDERPAMLYVQLGDLVPVCSCGSARADSNGRTWHNPQCNLTTGRVVEQEVLAVREVDRGEFDALTGIARLRREMGWTLS